MAGIATGVFKKLLIKRQTGLGVIAPAGDAGSAKSLRRVTSTLDKTKASYQSNEVLESQQVRDARHGVGQTGGTISGELSVGTYQLFFESILRQAAQANVSTGNIATIASAGIDDKTGTFSRSAGSFLADGFKIGDVVSSTGWTTSGAANNNKNMLIMSLSATVMKVLVLNKTPVANKAAGDSVLLLTVGRKIWVPPFGHTRDYYTIEHFFGDIGEDELFPDSVVTGATVALPPTGMATVEFPVLGLRMLTGKSQYFVAPSAPSTGGILASVNGALVIDGEVAGLVTGLTITIAGGYAYPTGDGIVGSNERPDVLPGTVTVTGQMTVLFANGTYRDKFLNEEEANLAVALTADNSANAGFTTFVMPRIKYNGSTKDEAATGLTQTMPFMALEKVTNSGGGTPNLQTTISIQDSSFG